MLGTLSLASSANAATTGTGTGTGTLDTTTYSAGEYHHVFTVDYTCVTGTDGKTNITLGFTNGSTTGSGTLVPDTADGGVFAFTAATGDYNSAYGGTYKQGRHGPRLRRTPATATTASTLVEPRTPTSAALSARSPKSRPATRPRFPPRWRATTASTSPVLRTQASRARTWPRSPRTGPGRPVQGLSHPHQLTARSLLGGLSSLSGARYRSA